MRYSDWEQHEMDVKSGKEMDRWVTEQEEKQRQEQVRKLVKEWDEHFKTHQERHEDEIAFEQFREAHGG